MAEKENSNLNITPEMIQNLANILSNSNNKQNSNTQSTNTNLNNNTNNIQNSDNQNTNTSAIFNNFFGNTNSDSSNNTIDIETILKMKSIFEKINNKDNPRNKLLYSLKPYLRESRQKKLDQYVNLLSISEITSLFKKEKGDEN